MLIKLTTSLWLDAEEDNRRLAAAANAIKLKKLHSEARRDSKVVKKKLQRQQDGEQGSRGSKQKEREELPELVPEEIDVFNELKKEPSQGGMVVKSCRTYLTA